MHFAIQRLQNSYWFFIRYQDKRIGGIAANRKEAFKLIFQIIRKETYEGTRNS